MPSTIEMEQVTPNVFTNTKLRGCNPSFVVTSDGVVVIDTPQLPTKAVAMRAEAEKHGPIRYLINTENHVDHIFGNYWFRGAGEIVNHKALWDIFMDPKAALDPFAYALEAIPTDDPEGAAILPDRDEYYADLPRGTVVFTGELAIPRPEAKVRSAELGARPESRVTARTTVLVVGDGFVAADLRSGRLTGKARRVLELHERGQRIEVLSEGEFLQMVGGHLAAVPA